MPAYSGPTAAVMAACLPSKQHFWAPGFPGNTTPNPPQPCKADVLTSHPPRSLNVALGEYATACLPLPQQSPRPLFWKKLHACLPHLSSNRDATGSLPFPIRVHGWVTGREEDVGQEAGHEPASFGPRLRRPVHRRERDSLGRRYLSGSLLCRGRKWKRSSILSPKAAGMVGGPKRPSVAWTLNRRVGVLKAE